MKEFSVQSLARIIKADLPKNIDGIIKGISIDSRTTGPGDCFFAIDGENYDGHDYLNDAFAKGATCAVVSKDLEGDRLLKVDDTIKALGQLAHDYRSKNNFKVVAITGSVGKTTTRQIAYHVLSHHYRCCQAPKNFNNYIGLPLTLLGANPQDQIVIVELGSNCPGEIAYLARIAQPDIAVITNVCPAHLAGFGSLQAIVDEKLSISEGLSKNGSLIINADCDSLLNTCRAGGLRFTTFGKSELCDVQASNITFNGSSTDFAVNGIQVTLPLPGSGNVENALAAWSVCSRLGLKIEDFARAVKTTPAVPMRTELLRAGNLTILNDCYNANPASMKNALDILANIRACQKARLVFICGDMAELGPQSKQLHAQLGAQIADAKVELLLAVGKFAKITTEAAKTNANYNLHTECFDNITSVCNKLQEFIKHSDIILVKGSRTAKLETAVEKLKHLFSKQKDFEAVI